MFKNDKNLEKKLDEINERMYYKVINYQFGYNQIKNLYKLTEVAALTFANKKKFDKIKVFVNSSLIIFVNSDVLFTS